MLRRRLLGGKKIQIPNGVYMVGYRPATGQANLHLYRLGDSIPSGTVLGALFIKETTTCFLIGVPEDSWGNPSLSLTAVSYDWDYRGAYYSTRDSCYEHVSDNVPSSSSQYSEMSMRSASLFPRNINRYSSIDILKYPSVPAVGDLEIIYNRLSDIQQLASYILSLSYGSADFTGIIKMFRDYTSWIDWGINTATPYSEYRYWVYTFGGASESDRLLGTYEYDNSPYYNVLVKYPTIHKSAYYKFYYRGYQLAEDTWGVDDVGYVP